MASTVLSPVEAGRVPNCFTSDGHGAIPVAILGTADFDVTQIDPATLELDGQVVRTTPKGKLQAHFKDANGDGVLELVLQFEDVAGTYPPGDGVGTLTGQTLDGPAHSRVSPTAGAQPTDTESA